jgi:hypothetical protein
MDTSFRNLIKEGFPRGGFAFLSFKRLQKIGELFQPYRLAKDYYDNN